MGFEMDFGFVVLEYIQSIFEIPVHSICEMLSLNGR